MFAQKTISRTMLLAECHKSIQMLVGRIFLEKYRGLESNEIEKKEKTN